MKQSEPGQGTDPRPRKPLDCGRKESLQSSLEVAAAEAMPAMHLPCGNTDVGIPMF